MQGVPPVPLPLTPYTPPTSAPMTVQTATSDVGLTQAANWLITDQNGNSILSFDSVIEFEYRGESQIADYPVEQGGFASYNKVSVPYEARMTVACTGQGNQKRDGWPRQTRDQFLASLETLRNAITLCQIISPDTIYPSCNLVHIDYRREARRGVTLILATLWFQEVRIAGTATTPTPNPSYANSLNLGALSPIDAPTSVTAVTSSQGDALNAISPTATATSTSGVVTSSIPSALQSLGANLTSTIAGLQLIPGSSAIVRQLNQMASIATLSGKAGSLVAGGVNPSSIASIPSLASGLASSLAGPGAASGGVAAVNSVIGSVQAGYGINQIAAQAIK